MVEAATIYEHGDVYSWLDELQKRPPMWAQNLSDVSHQLTGYYTALRIYGIIEAVPAMHGHFDTWVHLRTGWSTNCGWADAIESRFDGLDSQLKEFFRLVGEYRTLVPIVLCTARLEEHHQPTGKRVVIGSDQRMEKPERIDILKYEPEPLHFLRFHYPDKVRDDSLLMKYDGSHSTEMADVMSWARDELLVGQGDWKEPVPVGG